MKSSKETALGLANSWVSFNPYGSRTELLESIRRDGKVVPIDINDLSRKEFLISKHRKKNILGIVDGIVYELAKPFSYSLSSTTSSEEFKLFIKAFPLDQLDSLYSRNPIISTETYVYYPYDNKIFYVCDLVQRYKDRTNITQNTSYGSSDNTIKNNIKGLMGFKHNNHITIADSILMLSLGKSLTKFTNGHRFKVAPNFQIDLSPKSNEPLLRSIDSDECRKKVRDCIIKEGIIDIELFEDEPYSRLKNTVQSVLQSSGSSVINSIQYIVSYLGSNDNIDNSSLDDTMIMYLDEDENDVPSILKHGHAFKLSDKDVSDIELHWRQFLLSSSEEFMIEVFNKRLLNKKHLKDVLMRGLDDCFKK